MSEKFIAFPQIMGQFYPHLLWNEWLLLTIGLMAGAINACWEGYLVVMVLSAVRPGPLDLTSLGILTWLQFIPFFRVIIEHAITW